MRELLVVLVVFTIFLAGCSSLAAPTLTPVSFPTLNSTLDPTATPVPTLTSTLTRTPTLVPTLTPFLTPTLTPTPGYPADLAIAMEGGCGGWPTNRCYRVTIDAGGNVRYQQDGYYGTPQRKVAEITPEQIQELVNAINRANLWAFEDRPVPYDAGPLTISVTLNGRSKSLSRNDLFGRDCRVASPWGTPEPGWQALCELWQTVARTTKLDQLRVKHWSSPSPPPTPFPPNPPTNTSTPTRTPVFSSAKVVVTVYKDLNGDRTPEPSEMLNGIPVQLALPDGKILSATTQQGTATFDMWGDRTDIQITASLPNLYRSYQFFLPPSGTVPILFSFTPPIVPTKSA